MATTPNVNKLAACAVLLYAGGSKESKLELLEMLGLIDEDWAYTEPPASISAPLVEVNESIARLGGKQPQTGRRSHSVIPDVTDRSTLPAGLRGIPQS